MSLSEILVVILVAILVAKPEDIPVIIKKIQKFKLYISNIKDQALSYLTEDVKIDDIILDHSPEQLNFYLERIINMQGHYEGDYSLKELKARHNELIQLKSNNNLTAGDPLKK